MRTPVEVIAMLGKLPSDQFRFKLHGIRENLVRIVEDRHVCDCPLTALARHLTGKQYSPYGDFDEVITVIGLDDLGLRSLLCAADDCKSGGFNGHDHDPSLRPLLLQTLREAGLLVEAT